MAKKTTKKASRAASGRAPAADPPPSAAPPAPEQPTVDRFLIAVQKSLSRVSRDTGRHQRQRPDGAHAIITGNVEFEVTLECALAEDERLVLVDSGGRPLRLKGNVSVDVGITDAGGGPDRA